jgi:hypothetical protein
MQPDVIEVPVAGTVNVVEIDRDTDTVIEVTAAPSPGVVEILIDAPFDVIEVDSASTDVVEIFREQGPPGPQGPSGTGGDKNYVHTQGTLAITWTIVHNLGKNPSVEVVNSGDNVVLPNVHYDSLNQVTLTFDAPASGKAYVN